MENDPAESALYDYIAGKVRLRVPRAIVRPKSLGLVHSAIFLLENPSNQIESTSQPRAFHRVPVVKHLDKTDGVGQSSTSHEYVHDLMARAVNVKGPGVPLFRKAGSVDDSPCAIQEAKTQEIRNGHSSILHVPAVKEDSVDDGDEGRETEERKHD